MPRFNRTPDRARGFIFYPDDYLNDPVVLRMCLAARGAYTTLLFALWNQPTVGVCDDDDALLASLARATAEEWAAVRAAVARAFDLTTRPGSWVQKRMVEQHAEHEIQWSKRSEAGHANASKPRGINKIAKRERMASQRPPKTKPKNEVKDLEPNLSQKRGAGAPAVQDSLPLKPPPPPATGETRGPGAVARGDPAAAAALGAAVTGLAVAKAMPRKFADEAWDATDGHPDRKLLMSYAQNLRGRGDPEAFILPLVRECAGRGLNPWQYFNPAGEAYGSRRNQFAIEYAECAQVEIKRQPLFVVGGES